MKKIITIVFLFISFVSFSQPVITSAYNPSLADIYVYKIVDDTATAQVGQSGAGVIWGLASMHGQLTTRQYNWKQTALTLDAGTFGSNSNLAAEIVQNGFSTRYEYYSVGPNFTGDFKKVGSRNGAALANYFGGFTMYDYPMSYGQSSTDTMIGTTGVADINGRSTTTYDGYGTLQLEAQSGGNFSNVARIKVEQNYIVNYGPIETHHELIYYWFDHQTANMTKQPIAIIYLHEWIDLNGDPQRDKIALMRQILFQNGIPQQSLTSSNVTVYPNPFADYINISIPGINSEVNIEISDITGRIIKRIHPEKSMSNRIEEIVLSELNSGIYLAKISSDNGSVVKRIVKN